MQDLQSSIKALYSNLGFNPPVEDLVRFASSTKLMVETLSIKNFENSDLNQDLKQSL